MADKIECAGGTVVKEGEKKWVVFAPDGRRVDTKHTKKEALVRAEHWDKYDALGSLENILFAMSPFTMLLMTKMLNSIGQGKEMWEPTDEQLHMAVVVDSWLLIGRQLIVEGKISEEDFIKAMAEAVKKVSEEKAVAEMKKEKK